MSSEKNILLSTLGTSPMIVPQAFLTEGTSFDEVHIFTTDNEKAKDNYEKLNNFFKDKKVAFSFTITEDINLPNTTEQNHQFEESLYQWYLEKCGDTLPYVCLSGGTKTIPAIMQKAAQLFGAKEIFHVIPNKDAGKDPGTIEEVWNAIAINQIQVVRFGPETGWPAFRRISSSLPFSVSVCMEESFYKKKKPTDFIFLREIAGIQKRIKDHFKHQEKENVPFAGLLLLPSATRLWLKQPLQQSDWNWVNALPKTELHCHLGGFATQPPLLYEVRAKVKHPDKLKPVKDIHLPTQWPLPQETIPLNEYMHLGDNNGSTILSDPGCLEEQIKLLYEAFQKENIKYAEVRCSPYNYTRYQSALEVLEQITNTFQDLMDKADENNRCHVNLIIIVTRKDEGDLSSISKHLALAITAASNNKSDDGKCKVVGVDLAGFETKETRASYFQHDFEGAHRCRIAVTAHAGENDDAEGVWQAVFKLNARRIGHALHLFQAADLMRTFSDRGIAIEMCPYANYQIKGFFPMKDKEEKYPLLQYLKEGIPVTINTDNIGISAAGLTDNFMLAGKMLPELTRLNVLQLIRNGIEAAFISQTEKGKMLDLFEKGVLNACIRIPVENPK